VDRPLASTIWGLLKTASLENPLLSVRCLDLDRDAGVEEVWGELTAEDRESEVAYRDGRRHVRRLVQRPPSCPPSERRFVVRSDATYVVTGGTGSLGRLVARRLSERGAGRIVLLARKADECSAEDLSALAANPATDMVALPVDVSDREAVQEALRAARAAGPPVRGVVHAAGVLADRVLFDVTAESMRAVLAPKVMGAWTMHALTAEDPLDWFVLFSSAAGILGSPGQSSYSAANAFLDALAHHRRARGLPGIAIDWGPWAEVGMAAGVSDDIRRRRLGTAVSALDPGTGLSLFERLVREDLAQSVVLPFDLRDLLQFHPALDTTSFFDEVVQDATLSAMTTAARGTSMRPDLSTAYVAPRNPIEQRIAALWQASLGIAPVGVNDSFFELGGDSVLANQLLVEINRALDVRLDTGQAFEQLTVGHLAELAEEAVVRALALMDDDSAERLLQVPPPTDN
jgi:nucleoside-diphosphate-sugar epimerase/acyl carrier protein